MGESPGDAPALGDLIASVIEQTGVGWSLVGRLEGGFQQGAFLVESPAGDHAVLKRSHCAGLRRDVTEVASVVSLARSAGWPTPRWISWGTTHGGLDWWLTDFVEGTVPEKVDRAFLRAVLPVVERQAGLHPDTVHDWSAYTADVVFRDESAFMPTVAAFSDAGSRLVRAIEQATGGDRRCELPVDDVVHGNLDPGNVIVRDDQVVGIVDVDAIGKGSRAIDLAGLIVSAAVWGDDACLDDVVRAARGAAGEAGTRICVSAAAIALVAFGVAHWPHDVDPVAACCTELVADLH